MSVAPVMTFSKSPRYSSSARSPRLAIVLIFMVVLSIIPRQTSSAQTGWQWYKTDTHIHSVVSADAYPDLGILTSAAKAAGFNAIFVTDHNLASDFPANGSANLVPFEDSYLHLFTGTYGTQTAAVNELATTPVNTGTRSLHMVSTSTGSAETDTWAIRGPSLRSGDIILKVSIYPTRIDAGSGAYASVSRGGDTFRSDPGIASSIARDDTIYMITLVPRQTRDISEKDRLGHGPDRAACTADFRAHVGGCSIERDGFHHVIGASAHGIGRDHHTVPNPAYSITTGHSTRDSQPYICGALCVWHIDRITSRVRVLRRAIQVKDCWA